MAKKGALCSSLFISRRTSLAGTDISSFCIKELEYFGERLGSRKSLSKTVSYLARSCMIKGKLPLFSFESSHWIREKVSCTLLTARATLLLLSPCFSIAHT